jgi:hypothetical protein
MSFTIGVWVYGDSKWKEGCKMMVCVSMWLVCFRCIMRLGYLGCSGVGERWDTYKLSINEEVVCL